MGQGIRSPLCYVCDAELDTRGSGAVPLCLRCKAGDREVTPAAYSAPRTSEAKQYDYGAPVVTTMWGGHGAANYPWFLPNNAVSHMFPQAVASGAPITLNVNSLTGDRAEIGRGIQEALGKHYKQAFEQTGITVVIHRRSVDVRRGIAHALCGQVGGRLAEEGDVINCEACLKAGRPEWKGPPMEDLQKKAAAEMRAIDSLRPCRHPDFTRGFCVGCGSPEALIKSLSH